MDQGWQTLEIDGRSFSVCRLAQVDGAELSVALGGSRTLRLRPWTLAQHLAALDRHAFYDGERPRIDHEGLATEVIERTSVEPVDANLAGELAPLALWWAFGGDHPPESTPPVRSWSCLDRARAIDECTDPNTGALRLGSYLRAMVRASSDIDIDTDEVSGATAASFLDALISAHTIVPESAEGPGSAALAHATLQVCRALSWTPSQVWSLPAAELDRLLRLIERLETPRARPSPPASRTGLAAYPDSVIVEVT